MDNKHYRGTVLVVEDNDLERETLLALMRRAGHTAWGVGDASSALMALEELRDEIDVVLCDLRLTVSSQNGVDLLRRWKERRASTPFVFVTGVYEIAQVVEAVKLGAEDYITKPYNTSELLRRVAECIEASRESAVPVQAGQPFNADELNEDWFSGYTLVELERIAMEHALQRTGGNRTHAANALGISVRTLQRKLKAWASDVAVALEHMPTA